MKRTLRNICKTLDQVAGNNEDATVSMMRAAERVNDELLRQQLFNAIHRMSLDAAMLRTTRDDLATQGLKHA